MHDAEGRSFLQLPSLIYLESGHPERPGKPRGWGVWVVVLFPGLQSRGQRSWLAVPWYPGSPGPHRLGGAGPPTQTHRHTHTHTHTHTETHTRAAAGALFWWRKLPPCDAGSGWNQHLASSLTSGTLLTLPLIPGFMWVSDVDTEARRGSATPPLPLLGRPQRASGFAAAESQPPVNSKQLLIPPAPPPHARQQAARPLPFPHASPLIFSGFILQPESPAATPRGPLVLSRLAMGLGDLSLHSPPPAAPSAPPPRQRGSSPPSLASQEHLPRGVIRGSAPGVAAPGRRGGGGAGYLLHQSRADAAELGGGERGEGRTGPRAPGRPPLAAPCRCRPRFC